MKNPKVLLYGLVLLLLVNSAAFAEMPMVSTVFFESDVRDAVNELVFQTGINIIMDETVRGIITLDLDNVPLEKALTMISMAGGFSYRKIDDFYFLGIADPQNPSFQYLADTESIKLQYISQEEARALLPPIYDNYLRSSPERDVISITAPEIIRERFRQDIAAIDQKVQQVLIQAIVTEISHEALEEYGINLLDFSRGHSGTDAEWKGVRLSSEAADFVDTLTFRGRLSTYGDLLAQLRMLESENQAEIKANPRVLVTDRSTVNIFSGQTQHLVLSSSSTSASLEAVDVGISLRVTPKIINSDELEIVITPEVSHFVNDRYKSKTGLVVRRNEVSTSVFVKNGQALLIAGLTLDEVSDIRNRVPILGSIPVVRWLFSSSTKHVAGRELIVFLIAEIQ